MLKMNTPRDVFNDSMKAVHGIKNQPLHLPVPRVELGVKSSPDDRVSQAITFLPLPAPTSGRTRNHVQQAGEGGGMPRKERDKQAGSPCAWFIPRQLGDGGRFKSQIKLTFAIHMGINIQFLNWNPLLLVSSNDHGIFLYLNLMTSHEKAQLFTGAGRTSASNSV